MLWFVVRCFKPRCRSKPSKTEGKFGDLLEIGRFPFIPIPAPYTFCVRVVAVFVEPVSSHGSFRTAVTQPSGCGLSLTSATHPSPFSGGPSAVRNSWSLIRPSGLGDQMRFKCVLVSVLVFFAVGFIHLRLGLHSSIRVSQWMGEYKRKGTEQVNFWRTPDAHIPARCFLSPSFPLSTGSLFRGRKYFLLSTVSWPGWRAYFALDRNFAAAGWMEMGGKKWFATAAHATRRAVASAVALNSFHSF